MTPNNPWQRHVATNRRQTLLLVASLFGIASLSGWLLFGETGFWMAVGAVGFALLLEPAAVWRWTLAMYRARPLHPTEAPEVWQLVRQLAERAGLGSVPALYYIPSAIVNGFAVGNRKLAAVALTDGLLRAMSPREMAGVLAHEIAHIVHDDLRVMGLADYISRLTSLLAFMGQISLMLVLPWWLSGSVEVNWPGLLFIAFAPQLALLAQLGLSRVREFDADLAAARLTGDPLGLAQALAKLEKLSHSWRNWLLPGWGNPEPSWLRTHPATEERVVRLMELAHTTPSGYPYDRFEVASLPVRQSPRWHVGGLWH